MIATSYNTEYFGPGIYRFMKAIGIMTLSVIYIERNWYFFLFVDSLTRGELVHAQSFTAVSFIGDFISGSTKTAADHCEY